MDSRKLIAAVMRQLRKKNSSQTGSWRFSISSIV